MPKFDKNRHYYNKKGQRIGTGVWVRDNGQLLTPGWADINKEDRTVKVVVGTEVLGYEAVTTQIPVPKAMV